MGFSIQIHSSLRPTGDANFHFARTICKLYIIVHTRYTHGYCTYPVYPWLLYIPVIPMVIVHTRYTHGYCTYPVYPWILYIPGIPMIIAHKQ